MAMQVQLLLHITAMVSGIMAAMAHVEASVLSLLQGDADGQPAGAYMKLNNQQEQ